MIGGTLLHFSYDFVFPATEPPPWASQVERWYQLDSAAFGLPTAVHHWRASDNRLRLPDFLVLASPDGCNQTDYDFALSLKATGIASPSKFVHTLPNSRSSALLQVLNHFGPMVCVQSDPSTFVAGLELGFEQITAEAAIRTAWVLGVSQREPNHYRAQLFQLTESPENGSFSWRPRRFNDKGKNPSLTDAQLLDWFKMPSDRPLELTSRWDLEPSSVR